MVNAMPTHSPSRSPEMQQCIEHCQRCHVTCLEMAATHCLEAGGKHVEPTHDRLMLDCAQICQTSADFMLRQSELHAHVCAACAVVCEACAQSCEAVGGMDECVRACRTCAESCRAMGQAVDARGGQTPPSGASVGVEGDESGGAPVSVG